MSENASPPCCDDAPTPDTIRKDPSVHFAPQSGRSGCHFDFPKAGHGNADNGVVVRLSAFGHKLG